MRPANAQARPRRGEPSDRLRVEPDELARCYEARTRRHRGPRRRSRSRRSPHSAFRPGRDAEVGDRAAITAADEPLLRGVGASRSRDVGRSGTSSIHGRATVAMVGCGYDSLPSWSGGSAAPDRAQRGLVREALCLLGLRVHE